MVRIAFVIKNITLTPPLGIMSLSSALKKAGHKTILICFKEKEALDELKLFKPDILAYSVTTGIHKDYIEINKKIKSKYKNIFTIMGGPHPTFYPEIIKEEGIDAICRGEGEESFVDFANNFKKKDNIKNFWIKKKNKIIKNGLRPLSNLNKLEFPDRELIYKKYEFFKNLKIKRFIASRGCPFCCTYCFNKYYNELYGNPKVRYRNIDNIIREINLVKKKYPLKLVKFVDDTFNLNIEWLEEFCEKYKILGVPFVCNIRADLVTEKQVKMLKKANCKIVYLGIESGNEELRKNILKRNMSNKQILNTCRLLNKYKIKIITQNMLGLPGEKIENCFETILLNSRCKPTFAGFSIFQPYPKTALYNYSVKHNYFDGNLDKLSSNYLSKSCLNYTKKEKRQIENLYLLSTIAVMFPSLHFLVKLLIKFNGKKLYKIIYFLFYGWSQFRVYSIISDSYIELFRLMKRLSEYLFRT